MIEMIQGKIQEDVLTRAFVSSLLGAQVRTQCAPGDVHQHAPGLSPPSPPLPRASQLTLTPCYSPGLRLPPAHREIPRHARSLARPATRRRAPPHRLPVRHRHLAAGPFLLLLLVLLCVWICVGVWISIRFCVGVRICVEQRGADAAPQVHLDRPDAAFPAGRAVANLRKARERENAAVAL